MRFSSPSPVHSVLLFLGMSSQVHATSTCLRVVTGTDTWADGYLNMFVNSGDGSGYVSVTEIGAQYVLGETVLEECYTGLIGVQVQNAYLDGWGGSIEASVDGGITYSPMVCEDKCTPAGGATSFIFVDGDGDDNVYDSAVVECLNGETCTLAPGPTNLPTPGPSHSPTNSPTNSPTPAIDSWDLELTSVDSNFDNGSGSEITLTYKIGEGRKFGFTVLKKGCKEAIDSAIIIPTNSTSPHENDPSLDNLSVFLDVKKDTIAGSNIWNPDSNFLEFCLSLWLLSSSSGIVVKKVEHDFGIELLFDTAFETVDQAQFGQITLGSNQTDAQVDNYIEACTCDSKESFECNQNVLGPNDFLNICIISLAEEVEIDFLDSLKMVQGDKTLDIVWNKTLVDSSISSKSKVALKNGVHVASVIPARFFSYESSSTAQVSGVVFLKLAEGRRRLAVEIDDSTSSAPATGARMLQSVAGDQESAFAMEVQLEKNELGAGAESSSAIYAVMNVAAVVTATAAISMMLW